MSGVGHRKTKLVDEIINWRDKQDDFIYVAGEKGNNSTGNGTKFKPFRTAQGAIDWAVSQSKTQIFIVLDNKVQENSIDIPTGCLVSVMFLSGGYALTPKEQLKFVDLYGTAVFVANNVRINTIREDPSATSPVVFMEDSRLDNVGTIGKTTFLLSGTVMSKATWQAMRDNALSAKGIVLEETTGFPLTLSGDPVEPEHLVRKAVIDALSHSVLLNLNWSVAGHVIDANIDMNGYKVIDCPTVEGPADSDAGLEAGVGFNTFSQMGDKAGATAHNFRDSDKTTVASVDSLGKATLKGIDNSGQPIENVADPTANQEAATKKYVDDAAYSDADAQDAVQYQPDVALAGATPVNADVTGWADGDRGHGVGTGGREFYMVKRGTAVKYVELS